MNDIDDYQILLGLFKLVCEFKFIFMLRNFQFF